MGQDYSDLKGTEALYRTFNDVSKALPDLCYDAGPIGMGNFGIVIAHDDDTLTKIFFRHKSEAANITSLSSFQNETHALRIFAENPLDGVKTPILIGKPKTHGHEDFMASYNMTRIHGTTDIWDQNPHATHESKRKTYENAGRALANFHRTAHGLPFKETSYRSSFFKNIQTSILLDERTNRALADTNEYLQAHKQAGIEHGDYHWGNIVVNGDGDVTGLIDFSFVGKSNNQLLDFIFIEDENLPDFLHGYEQESGQAIAPFLMAATRLSVLTHQLNCILEKEKQDEKTNQINKWLKELAPVTGYNPK